MHSHVIVGVVVSLVLLCCATSGCGHCRGGGDGGGDGRASMTFVYLKTGPNSASHTPEQKSEIFKGHMANMTRLRDERTLIIGGPFVQPRDKAWRGIFIFDVADVGEAEKIGAAQTLFTHIAHGLGHAETNADLPPNLRLAYDGQRVTARLA